MTTSRPNMRLLIVTFLVTQASFSQVRIIVYHVTGSSETSDLTYTNQDEGTAQEKAAILPSMHLLVVKKGFFASISAQTGQACGSVDVKIYSKTISGKTWKLYLKESAFIDEDLKYLKEHEQTMNPEAVKNRLQKMSNMMSGHIKTILLEDSHPVRTSTSYGAFAVASVSYMVK